MEKKSFYKGVASGLIVAMISLAAYNGVAIAKSGDGMSIDRKVGAISALLNKNYVEEIDLSKMEEGIYTGLVASLGDPYTTYMSKQQLSSFLDDTGGSFYGIGITVTMDKIDNNLVVVSPIQGSPADVAGMKPKDKIIKVDDIETSGHTVDEVVSLMKGAEGTEVKVTVYRQSTGETLDFKIKRAMIDVQSVEGKMLENGIGYIKITQFSKNTYEQFVKVYDKLNAQNQKGLIIDVRNNPGGLFDVVEKIADMLVPEGTLVYTVDKNGTRKDSISDEKRIEIPLCLLVNGNSASASEILAGAVQDMGVGKLVGTQTFGKGLVQGLYSLSDGSGVKITIQKYYTPKGVCIQGEGITPDYAVELPIEYKNELIVEPDKDTQLKEAIKVINEQLN